jgi:hypothetical protein
LDVKNSVKLATTSELTNEDASPPTYDNGTAGVGATLTFEPAILFIDGVGGLQNGDRILIKDQSDQATNGIYVRTSGTVYTRAVDADSASELTGGTFVFVEQGTVNGDSGFVFTHNGTPTVGTTALTVSQFSGAGQITAGAGLEKSGNTLSVADGGITNSKLQNSGIIVVDDTSTASTISLGETLKIAGGTGITTAVSGDTLTITGPDLTSYATQSYVTSQGYITNSTITVVGDDSTGTSFNTGETIKVLGAGGITGSVSGDTLTVDGSNLLQYARVIVVGDDSTGSTFDLTEANNTLEIQGAGTVTTAVSGNTVTITGSNPVGDLTVIGSTISSPSNADITVVTSGSGRIVAGAPLEIQKGYIEAINALTSSSTITVDFSTASVHTVTLAENTQFVITNLPTGGTGTIIITQDGGGSNTGSFGTDGSTAVKFAGGTPTLSTAGNAIDVVTIFNDGTNYLGNIAKAYAA